MDTILIIIIAAGCVVLLVGLWIAWQRRSARPARTRGPVTSPAELAERSAEHQQNLTHLLRRYHGDSTLIDDSAADPAAHELNA
ncbi:MAG: hypothetical protein IPO93_08120 [Actinobacteria bacterium]|nr:hypothetical protein [Actinomycetota bacterium]